MNGCFTEDSITFIGKKEPIDITIIEDYLEDGVSQLKEHFDIDDGNYQLVNTVRKYTYDRSYLFFTFFGDDRNYDVIYQRNNRGSDQEILTYLVESVGRQGMVTKICFLGRDNPKIIVGDIGNSPLALKVEGIIKELCI